LVGVFFGPRRRAALSSHRVRRSYSPRRLAALSSHRVRRSHSPHRRVDAPRSLRITIGGRIVRVGSPRSLRIAFGGRIARVGAPRPTQQHAYLHRNICTCTCIGLAIDLVNKRGVTQSKFSGPADLADGVRHRTTTATSIKVANGGAIR
jgi:hypothetical protein